MASASGSIYEMISPCVGVSLSCPVTTARWTTAINR